VFRSAPDTSQDEAQRARVEAAVDRALALRLLGDSPVAELAQSVVGAATALFLLLSSSARLADLLGWGLVVNAAALARVVWRQRAVAAGLDAAAMRRGARIRVAALGLAWGLGAALVAPQLPIRYEALILVVLSALVAGGLVTLAPDRGSFLAFVACTLGPLPVGLLLQSAGHDYIATAILIVLFGGFMVVLGERSHRTLVEHERTKVLLAEREQAAIRERAYLNAVLVSAPDAIVVMNGEGRVTAVNARFELLFGYPASEALGRDLTALVVPDGAGVEASELLERARGGEAPVVESVRRCKDGHLVPVRVAAARLEGTLEEEICFLYDDITERKRAEEAMRKARDEAERTAVARASFLANMSHEIRTPMNAVLGLVELTLDTDLTTEQRRALELVRSSSDALLTVLNDILDFSKIEAGHLEVEAIPFDLAKLIHSSVSLLAVRAREKHVELITDIPPEVPALVRGDPTRIRQVLTNLTGNAIKFTEEGEVVVSAVPAGVEDGRTRIRFGVRDTGIGIPPEQLATVFQEFTQADASMTRRYGGTGLGLAIATRLVALMGGELKVTSEVGRGSEFSFTVPFLLDTAPPSSPAARKPVTLTRQRVLVVDDNQTNRRILRDTLAAEGMAVDEAAGAEAGLDALRRAAASGAPVHLAIIDAQMPDRDGFELAASVQADPQLSGTRLVMLTSAGQRGDAQRCAELGIEGYLTKPIARADLLEAVGVVVAGPEHPAGRAGVVTRHSIAESRRRLRILLAEDNPVNQEVAATMLRKRGHQVDIVGDGRAAVEAVRRARYDAVLMDIQMPEMDGVAATQAIRLLPGKQGLPIIALTADALSGERERCLAAGMTGYQTKPFKSHELFALVEGWAEASPSQPVGAAGPGGGDGGDIDLDDFRRTMREAGAEEAVDRILQTFVRTAPERVAALATAVTAGNPAAVAAAAHAYKSAAAAIGARGLATLLQSLEAAGRAGAVEQGRERLADLHAASAAVIAAVEAALQESGSPGTDG
jgi:PAS domain S-box-containing protein